LRIALDTNVVAYAEGVDGAERRSITLALLRDLPPGSVVIPAQVLGELFNVLVRKAGRSRAKARNALLGWRDAFPVVETSPDVMVKAADLATDHHLGIWDAVILSAASLAGCQLFLSEDLHDSFVWGGVTVANPYAAKRNAVLEALLRP
jgi:predicted nucleic acid-binding protein